MVNNRVPVRYRVVWNQVQLLGDYNTRVRIVHEYVIITKKLHAKLLLLCCFLLFHWLILLCGSVTGRNSKLHVLKQSCFITRSTYNTRKEIPFSNCSYNT